MKQLISIILISIICLIFLPVKHFAQSTDSPKIKISAYLDSYFATDNDKIIQNDDNSLKSARQLTYVNYKKNEFALNIAQISAELSADRFRANVTLQAGDLVKTGYQDLGAQFPMLQQANVGYNFYSGFWIDAGLFLTHIGGEAMLPKDNWLSSHSLVTYFEPFYQSGVKVSYENEKMTACIHILNGNGIIADNNFNKSVGLFFSHKCTDNFNFSYSNIYGNEEVGSPINAKIHFLQNLVLNYNLAEKLALRGQFDLANKNFTDNTNPFGENSKMYFGGSLTAHYLINDKFSATCRAAYVDNTDSLYVPTIKGLAYTLGAEYKPSDFTYIRLEGSLTDLDENYKMFIDADNKPAASRMEVALNFGVIIK
ncbi:MAG: outer membrane beta-barrel protein [bacterium]